MLARGKRDGETPRSNGRFACKKRFHCHSQIFRCCPTCARLRLVSWTSAHPSNDSALMKNNLLCSVTNRVGVGRILNRPSTRMSPDIIGNTLGSHRTSSGTHSGVTVHHRETPDIIDITGNTLESQPTLSATIAWSKSKLFLKSQVYQGCS